jgi:HEPN domain-containing protein
MAKVGFLKERAEEFLKMAKFAFKEGNFNIAAFNLEQACQLYLKYYLFLKLRRYPKTHSLEELLKGIGKAYKKEKEVKKILAEKTSVIGDLEQAYLTSRYLPVEFSKKRIENMLDFANELFNFLKNL